MIAKIALLINNFSYFVRLFRLLEKGVSEGMTTYLVNKAFDDIEEAFREVKTVEEARKSAAEIDDIFIG